MRIWRSVLVAAFRLTAVGLACLALGTVEAQDPNACDVAGEAPDVIVGDLPSTLRWGKVGDITAFSVATTSCNTGDCWLNWISNTNEHPVIAQNMYKLKDGRMEQIGQSWLKHGFFALSETYCSSNCVGTTGSHLGVNCSDPYSSFLNGDQGRLGPRSEVNPSTGVFAYPFTTQGQGGDPIYKRLQVHDADLDPALNSGALYLVEGLYITQDDAAAGNSANNASWRPMVVLDQGGGTYDIQVTGSTTQEQSVVWAWFLAESGVRVAGFSIPGDGVIMAASKASSLGGGVFHYEYAIQNLTSDRAGGSFSVEVPEGATVTNIGFHDVDYHSGEPYDGTDWSMTHDEVQNKVIWSTVPHVVDPNANALRWGTLYNFYFDVDATPLTKPVTLGLFKPGTPSEVQTAANAPDVCNNDGVCDVGEDCTNCAADCVGQGPGTCCGDGTCEPGENSCICSADCGPPAIAELVCTDSLDDDCDGQTDCADLDCCTDGACLDGIDLDNDTVAECDCNDNDPQIWETPGEVAGLTLDGPSIQWSMPLIPGGASPMFELVRSNDPRDFLGAGSCVLPTAQSGLSTTDAAIPLSGEVYHYLVRAVNDCPDSDGTLGLGWNGERLGLSCP